MTRSAKRPEVCIRRAVPDDRAALDRLWKEVDDLHARLVPDFFRPSRAPARPADVTGDAGGRQRVVLLAEVEGEPAGLVHVELFDTPPSPTMVPCRRGHIEDIVPVVEFLASPRSQWVTAQTLFVNGGYLAR